MGKPNNAGYKRSWKNYLLNARYQLRFTIFMVGISALLMAGLGWWVMHAAKKSTTVAMDNVLGIVCKAPELPGATPHVEIEEPEPEPEPEDRPRVVVEIEEQRVPPPRLPTTDIARYQLCKLAQVSTIERLHTGEWRIFYVLIAAGVLLCLGLGIYGIKMTHRVAGPLHKVKLYFASMQSGRYDTVWNLRKGDQLVSFYAHFKEAHAGLVKVETEDVEMLRDLIAAADAAHIGDGSADSKAALDELREILKTKEDAING